MKPLTLEAVELPTNENFNADATPTDALEQESLFENFVDEIDVWARRALAANGFGDY